MLFDEPQEGNESRGGEAGNPAGGPDRDRRGEGQFLSLLVGQELHGGVGVVQVRRQLQPSLPPDLVELVLLFLDELLVQGVHFQPVVEAERTLRHLKWAHTSQLLDSLFVLGSFYDKSKWSESPDCIFSTAPVLKNYQPPGPFFPVLI